MPSETPIDSRMILQAEEFILDRCVEAEAILQLGRERAKEIGDRQIEYLLHQQGEALLNVSRIIGRIATRKGLPDSLRFPSGT